MLRYIIIAAAIVLGVAVIVAGWMNRDALGLKIASVNVNVPPKPGDAASPAVEIERAFVGDAPWVLSALPECFSQVSESRGPLTYVKAHIPEGSKQIVSPATISHADCVVTIEGDEALVRRGLDRFRIPPRVRFYQTKKLIAVLRRSSQGTELRVYEPASSLEHQ